LAHLATLQKIPATYSQRQYAEIGGLMSYGTNIADAWRQVGVYAGRFLKGATPADLPVVQASKFDLMRARAQATVRVWKKRLELQAHSRFAIRSAYGLPAATGAM
jgi:ABC-type uncharacterized transport system substrate-binding protein